MPSEGYSPAESADFLTEVPYVKWELKEILDNSDCILLMSHVRSGNIIVRYLSRSCLGWIFFVNSLIIWNHWVAQQKEGFTAGQILTVITATVWCDCSSFPNADLDINTKSHKIEILGHYLRCISNGHDHSFHCREIDCWVIVEELPTFLPRILAVHTRSDLLLMNNLDK